MFFLNTENTTNFLFKTKDYIYIEMFMTLTGAKFTKVLKTHLTSKLMKWTIHSDLSFYSVRVCFNFNILMMGINGSLWIELTAWHIQNMTWHWNKKRNRDNRTVFNVNTSIDFIGTKTKFRVMNLLITRQSQSLVQATEKPFTFSTLTGAKFTKVLKTHLTSKLMKWTIHSDLAFYSVRVCFNFNILMMGINGSLWIELTAWHIQISGG
jgi:hypothetical protein